MGRHRRPRRDVPPTSTQPDGQEERQLDRHEEEESSAAYLDWVGDPLHALGGGSDLAAELGWGSSGWSDPPPSTVDDKSVPRSAPRTLQPTSGLGLGQDATDHHGVRQGVISRADTEHMAAALLLAMREAD